MPIDARIPLGGVAAPITPPDIAKSYMTLAQLQQAQQQQQLTGLALQEGQQKQQEYQGLQAASTQYPGALNDPVQRQGFLGALSKTSPLTGLKFQQEFRASDTAQATQHKAEIEQRLKQIELIGQVAGSITDQPSYTRGVAILQANGVPTEHLSATYDPAVVEQYRLAALKGSDQLTAHHQALTLGETKRHNLASEEQAATGTAATLRGQDITARGQDLSQQTTIRGQDMTAGTAMLNRESENLRAGATRTNALETHLTDKFIEVSKPFRQISDAMGRIVVSGQKPDAAGDISLITAYMKMIDPETGIKDEERRLAASAGGWGDRAAGWLKHAMTGELLPDDIRDQYVARARSLYEQAVKDNTKLKQEFQEQAVKRGANPENVTMDFTSTATPPKAGAGAGGKAMTFDVLRGLAKKRGIPLDQAVQDAEAAGFTVR